MPTLSLYLALDGGSLSFLYGHNILIRLPCTVTFFFQVFVGESNLCHGRIDVVRLRRCPNLLTRALGGCRLYNILVNPGTTFTDST